MARSRRNRQPADSAGAAGNPVLASASIEQIVSEMGRRLNTSQQDQYEFLKLVRLPAPIGANLSRLQQAMHHGLQGWAAASKVAVGGQQPVRKKGHTFPETTRRVSSTYGPDGRAATMDRPIDHRRITDTQRRDMLLFPPIAMGLAARISPVVGSFASWAPECSDGVQRGVLKAILNGMLHKLVDDSMFGSLVYGFAPFELVWENQDLELDVVEGDDEDLVLDDPSLRVLARKSASKSATPPAGGGGGDGAALVPLQRQ